MFSVCIELLAALCLARRRVHATGIVDRIEAQSLCATAFVRQEHGRQKAPKPTQRSPYTDSVCSPRNHPSRDLCCIRDTL